MSREQIPQNPSPQEPEIEPKDIERLLIEALTKALDMVSAPDPEAYPPELEKKNFRIQIQEKEAVTRILLRDKITGYERDLGNFLPPGVRFKASDHFAFAPNEKEVLFKKDEVESRGFLLGLFHEIGHAKTTRRHEMPVLEELKAFLQALSSFLTSLKKNGLSPDKKRAVEDYLPAWYLEKEVALTAQSERNAWAYALKALRELQRDHFAVFTGFKNADAISHYINRCLYTYDVKHTLEMLEKMDVRALAQLTKSSKFIKKRKTFPSLIQIHKPD